MLPSVQRHSRKLHTSKSHHDKQAFAFCFHPALVCPAQNVKDAGIPEVHTHSKRKVQDPRADTLFKQLKKGMTAAAAAKKQQRLHHKQISSEGRLSSLTYTWLLLALAFERVLPTMPLLHLHFVVKINQDSQPRLCAFFARISAKPSTRSKRRPNVSVTFWFIRIVPTEQPNIRDPVHSASNHLAIEQICSVLHTGIEGHNSFSYN